MGWGKKGGGVGEERGRGRGRGGWATVRALLTQNNSEGITIPLLMDSKILNTHLRLLIAVCYADIF